MPKNLKEGDSMTKVYFTTTFREDEYETLRLTKPPYIYFSFALWRNRPIRDLFKMIGYRPKKVMIDPGSITFKKHNISTCILDISEYYLCDGYSIQEAAYALLDELRYLPQEVLSPFHRYIYYILANRNDIDYILSFDEIWHNNLYQDSNYYIYQIMKAMNLNPIPVFHYGADFSHLDRYVSEYNEIIALGGTLREKDISKRREWVKECIRRYPHQNFHWLGTQSKYVLQHMPEVYSCDGNSWKLTASYGRNRRPGQSKREKMLEIVKELQRFSREK
jgi:hypothetical protein